MLITGPTVARLLFRPRRWAHRRVIAGDFGPAVRCGRAWLVELRNVEERAGTVFSPSQLRDALGTTTPSSEEN